MSDEQQLPSSSESTSTPTRCVERAMEMGMRLFDEHVKAPRAHGNERLHLRGVVGGLLAAAFEPSVWSLRPIDDLSLHPRMQNLTGVDRMARSTLSDAMKRFDPQLIKPLIDAVSAQLPQMQRLDPQTRQLTRRLIAADGSWFNLAGKVTHALQCSRGNKGAQSRVRLNLQIDVDAFAPVFCDVSGKDQGNEAAAFARHIQRDCIYLVDRNFVSFAFINRVLENQSNLVLRLKKGVNFQVETSKSLDQEDHSHGVLGDEIGHLTGPVSDGNADARSCTAKPPGQTLRRVVVRDEKNKTEVILLTDLLDVPAHVICLLYRLRWQIELFLRWLKVLAGFDHLINQSARGITMQFYIAVLMTLLIQIQTGMRVNKYALLWV
ncbi:MAG: IS4 family transposase, partial [Gaiellaceae bacterium]